MSSLEKIQQNLRILRMPTAVQVVGDLFAIASRETWTFEAFLGDRIENENTWHSRA